MSSETEHVFGNVEAQILKLRREVAGMEIAVAAAHAERDDARATAATALTANASLEADRLKVIVERDTAHDMLVAERTANLEQHQQTRVDLSEALAFGTNLPRERVPPLSDLLIAAKLQSADVSTSRKELASARGANAELVRERDEATKSRDGWKEAAERWERECGEARAEMGTLSTANNVCRKLADSIGRERDEARAILTRERDEARARARIVSAGPENVWRWQGGGDAIDSLSCPVVMEPETLRAILAERDEARSVRDAAWASRDLARDERDRMRDNAAKERDEARKERDEASGIIESMGRNFERERETHTKSLSEALGVQRVPDMVQAYDEIRSIRQERDACRAQLAAITLSFVGLSNGASVSKDGATGPYPAALARALQDLGAATKTLTEAQEAGSKLMLRVQRIRAAWEKTEQGDARMAADNYVALDAAIRGEVKP